MDKKILATTRQILLDKGAANFTIKDVVNVAGVSTATIYRRWSTVEALIFAALRSVAPEPKYINEGSLEKDLSEFLDYLAKSMLSFEGFVLADRRDSRLDPNLRGEIREMFTQPRMQLLQEILERAKERAEIPAIPALEDIWTYVAGPIQQRLYFRRALYTPEFAAEYKHIVLTILNIMVSQK